MESTQYQQLESLERVQEFCAQHPIDAPPPGYTAQVAVLDGIVGRLQQQVVVQQAEALATQGATQSQHALCHGLRRQHMVPLRRIALAWLGNVPEIEAKFHIPLPRSGQRALVTAAGAMAKNAEAHSDLFVTHGRAPDFIAKLEGAAAAVQRGIADKATGAAARSAATARVAEDLTQGRQVVRQLGAIILTRFEDDAGMLSLWRSAHRVSAVVGGRRRKAVVGQIVAPTPSGGTAGTPVAAAPVTPVTGTPEVSSAAA